MGGVAVARARAAAAAAAIAAAILACDLGSKAAVRELLAPNESVDLIPGVLWLSHVRNEGAAFGMLQGFQWVFALVSACVIVGIGIYLARTTVRSRWVVASLGLVAGGSAGNLYDRVVAGRVTDFVDLRWFPVFNVADSAITVGVAILIAVILFMPDDDEAAGGDDGADAPTDVTT